MRETVADEDARRVYVELIPDELDSAAKDVVYASKLDENGPVLGVATSMVCDALSRAVNRELGIDSSAFAGISILTLPDVSRKVVSVG